MRRIFAGLIILTLLLSGCASQTEPIVEFSIEPTTELTLINSEGKTIEERIKPPAGFTRQKAAEGSFDEFLRKIPLKPPGSKVNYYNGDVKNHDVYDAVIDLDIGTRDLQQCADAVIRLRAEYLYAKKQYNLIHFNFTNGFTAEYQKWMEGYRISIRDNQATWVKTAGCMNDYVNFRKYLDTVFTYAGTLSLSKELVPVTPEKMQIGDVFIQGGSPGHCVIVVDMAENEQTGEKLFLLAQSYMPAQYIQLLKNQNNSALSPWYPLDFGEVLTTPEWTFTRNDLKRFN